MRACPSHKDVEKRVLENSTQGEGRQLIPHFPKHFFECVGWAIKNTAIYRNLKACVKGDFVRRRGSHFGLAKYNVCSAFIPAGHFLRAELTLECRFLQFTVSFSHISRG